jgi:hypothetical protein
MGVDAINTFRVIAGRFTFCRVVSRRHRQRIRRSTGFLSLVRFPAAPLGDGQDKSSGPFFVLHQRRFGEVVGDEVTDQCRLVEMDEMTGTGNDFVSTSLGE